MWNKDASQSSGKYPECPQHIWRWGPRKLCEAGRWWQQEGPPRVGIEAAALFEEVRQTVVRRGFINPEVLKFPQLISPGMWVIVYCKEGDLQCVLAQEVLENRISQKSKFLCSYILNTCESPEKSQEERWREQGESVGASDELFNCENICKWPKIKGSPVQEEGSSTTDQTFCYLVAFPLPLPCL